MSASSELLEILSERYSHSLETFDTVGSFDVIEERFLPVFRDFERMKYLEGIDTYSSVLKRSMYMNDVPEKRTIVKLDTQGAEPDVTSIDAKKATAATDHATGNGRYPWPVELRDMLPFSLERVSMRDRHWVQHGHKAQLKILQAVADLVEDPRFARLKQVCLWAVAANSRGAADPDYSFDWDADTVARIEARGVELHRHGKNGGPMEFEEHVRLHRDWNGGLTEVETDPRPPGQRR